MDAYTEVEARWINLDPSTIELKLQDINAVREGSYHFREWVFWHDNWEDTRRRIRVRTDGETH